MSRVLTESEKLLQICSDINMSKMEDYVLSGHQVSREDMLALKNWKIDKARRDAEAKIVNHAAERLETRIHEIEKKIEEGKMQESPALREFINNWYWEHR